MSTKPAEPLFMEDCVASQRDTSRRTVVEAACLFLIACFLLFVGMPLRPSVYDEGIVLTNAMRVAAGQIPHRDFYANYGPAQFYILAGLFRVFGESILAERIFDLVVRGLLVASVYFIVSSYCRRRVALCASLGTLVWLYGLYGTAGFAVVPVSLLNLISAPLILPLFRHNLSVRRLLAVGALAGAATLFRYDTGIALLGIDACVITIAVSLRPNVGRLRTIASAFGNCLLGFAVVTIPAAIYYLSVAPLYDFVHDIILYPGKFYRRARGLPFPAISWKDIDNLEVYLLIATIVISSYAAVVIYRRARGKGLLNVQSESESQRWLGFFVTFTLLVFFMYLKGFVRISVIHLYLAIIPSVPLLAVLFQRRLDLPRPARISIMLLVGLSLLSAMWSGGREMFDTYSERTSVAGSVVNLVRGKSSQIRTMWCRAAPSLTRGLCFLPDDDHIKVVEFIDSHTTPDQKLFVGLPNHERIFVNDNLTYFASQRLPATKWSHFDPDLQNSYGIQVEMIRDLEATAPPYVALDSEFDKVHEPNDSSKSTGVTLLDDYIRSKYLYARRFGEMAIWQRIPSR